MFVIVKNLIYIEIIRTGKYKYADCHICEYFPIASMISNVKDF